MFSAFFKSIDILGAKFHFYTNEHRTKRTVIGGILTILIIINNNNIYIILYNIWR